MLTNLLSITTLYFFIISLTNVILSSAKSICTVRYGRGINVFMNVIAYSFYTVVVKQTANLPLDVTIITTAVANAIGVWISYVLLDKLQKDRLWKVEAIIPSKFAKELHCELINIPHNYIELGNKTLFDFYCETRLDTSTVIKASRKFNGKLFAVENKL